MKLTKYFNSRTALVAAAASAVSALASASVDVAPITAALTDIGIVAVAVFGVFVAVHAGKWIRRML